MKISKISAITVWINYYFRIFVKHYYNYNRVCGGGHMQD